jgi:glyoxylase-like metal-dependent hydrolase (beta-lactamase superfamily II)
MAKNVIRVLPTLRIELDKSAMTYLMNMGQRIAVPAYIFYIDGPDKNILVDSGCPAVQGRKYWSEPVNDITPFEDALKNVGLAPKDIDIVIHTHLNWDHVGNSNKCTKARLLVHQDELAFAKLRHPYLPGPYQPETYDKLKFELLKGDQQIAEGVKAIFTPGHSPGGLSVAVDTAQGKTVIPGLCSIKDNFDPPKEIRAFFPEAMTPGIHTNAVQAYESIIKIKKMADLVLPLHEPSLKEKY